MTIEPPKENTGRAIFRAAVEQAVELVPLAGGMLTALFKVTHPSTLERELGQWRMNASAMLNDHEARLIVLENQQRPTIVLSQVALDLGIWLVSASDAYWPGFQDFEAVTAAFPTVGSGELKEAFSELEELGLAEVGRVLGRDGYRVCATWPLYWLFSPMTSGTTPVHDALKLATMGLTQEDTWLNSRRLSDEIGWEPRRINSAMTMIADILPRAMKSNERSPDYVVPAIYIDAAARLKLRRFVERAAEAGVEATGS